MTEQHSPSGFHFSTSQKAALAKIEASLKNTLLSKTQIVDALIEGLQQFGLENVYVYLLDPATLEIDHTQPEEAWPLPESEKAALIRQTQEHLIRHGRQGVSEHYISDRAQSLLTDKHQLKTDRTLHGYDCNDGLYKVMISEDGLFLAIVFAHNWHLHTPLPYPQFNPETLDHLHQFFDEAVTALDNLNIHKKIESLLTDKQTLMQRIRKDEEDLKHRILELGVLYDTSNSLGHAVNYYEIISLILDAMFKVMKVDICGIFLLDFVPGGELFIRANHPAQDSVIKAVQQNMLTAIGPFIGRQIDRNKVSFTTENVDGNSPDDPETSGQIKSFANIPLVFKDSIMGMLNVCAASENAFARNEMTFLHTMANHLSSHLGRLKIVKELEKSKISTMVRSMAEGVIMLDENNQLDTINPAAMEYLGLSASVNLSSEVLIKTFEDIGLLALYYEALVNGESILNREIYHQDRFLSANVTPVLDSGGKRIGMVIALRDVTELQKNDRIKTQRLEVISRVNLILNSIQDLDALLTVLMEFVLNVASAEMGSIQLKEGKQFQTRVHSNFPDKIRREYQYTTGDTISEFVAKRREICFIEDYPNDKTVTQNTKIQISSYVCIPIMAKSEIIGVVNIVRKAENTAQKITLDDIETLTTITSISGTAIQNAILFQDMIKKQKLDQELKVAHDIQQRLLPSELPKIDGFNFGAISNPAREIGGDYYDFFRLENGLLGIVVADIVGKGVPAALFMIMVKSIMQTHILSIKSPSEALTKLNSIIFKDPVINRFVPMFYGVLDTKTKTFRYCNAGHEPAIILSGNRFKLLKSDASPLGAWEDSVFEESTLKLKDGDVVCIYTDGIIEARSDEQGDFGEARIRQCVRGYKGMSAKQMTDHIYQDIQEFVGNHPQHDDLTMVVMKVGIEIPESEGEKPISAKEIKVTSSKKQVSKVRQEVDRICSEVGFKPDDAFNIKLAINEAHANVIDHAYSGRENGEIIFQFFHFADRLEISIIDFGRGMDQKTIKNENHLDELEGSGLGVFLIKNLMDKVEYKKTLKGGTELKLVKYISKG